MSSPRIVFAGTPAFALASLTALVEAGLSPIAAYTQPDRPAGRGQRTTASPVKRFAESVGMQVMQPHSFRGEDAAAELSALRPDILIVAAYGLLLPQRILDIPTVGCLNVHASLLPRWRGAAPIQASILAGDQTTGVCLMKMTAGLDCGPVFSSRETTISSEENAAELHDRLALLGSELLIVDLGAILNKSITPVAQDDSIATYASKIQKQDAEIDWTLPAGAVHRHIRAYNPAPGAFFFAVGGERIKVWRAEQVTNVNAPSGSFVQFDRDGVIVACGQDALRLTELQLAGKRRAPAHEFVSQIDPR